MSHDNKNKKLDTPERTEQRKEERKWKEQDEFTEPSNNRLDMESEISNARRNESMSDSQDGNERMVPDTKANQSEKDFQEERKLPQMKK